MNLRKEMLVAIALGLVLGGIAAVLVTQAPYQFFAKKSEPTVSPSPVTEEAPSPTPDTSLKLDVLFPADQSIAEEKDLTVSGKTKAGVTVVVTAPFDEKVVIASDDGTFQAPITLQEGANELSITAVSSETEVEKTLTVNYTSEEL